MARYSMGQASLLSRLSASLGKQRAALEINWMRQAAQSPHALQLMVDRRVRGEPLQYILGSQPFGPLSIIARAPTLIPRPETEQWTSALATRIQARPASRHPLKMLDLCTGSGCIPLLLCHLLQENSASPVNIDALGVDVSLSACQLARDNVVSSGTPPGCWLDIQQKNIFDEDFWDFVQKSFKEQRPHRLGRNNNDSEVVQIDVLTANPPYVPTDQWRRLPSDVKDWEDPVALLGDPPHAANGRGLTFYKRIKEMLSGGILSPQCVLALEIGEGQAADVVEIFGTEFGSVEIWKDLWGKERAVFINGDASSAI